MYKIICILYLSWYLNSVSQFLATACRIIVIVVITTLITKFPNLMQEA